MILSNFKNWFLVESGEGVPFNISRLVTYGLQINRAFDIMLKHPDNYEFSLLKRIHDYFQDDNGFFKTIRVITKQVEKPTADDVPISRNYLQRLKAVTIYVKSLFKEIDNESVRKLLDTYCNYIIQDVNNALRSN